MLNVCTHFPSQNMSMLVAKAKEQEERVCELSRFEAHYWKLQREMETAGVQTEEYKQTIEVC